MKNIKNAEQLEVVERIFESVKAHFILHEIRAVLDKWAAVKIQGPELARLMEDVERIIEQAKEKEAE